MESRWVLDTMRDLAGGASTRYLAVPSFEHIYGRDHGGRISLPLEGFPGDGDPRHWWSLSYSIPAGRYRVAGIPDGVAFCNGDSAFLVDETEFSSGVALERFRLRARERIDSARLSLVEARESDHRAYLTVPLANGVRLHVLDESVYHDPDGLWVRRSRRARFALELTHGDRAGSALTIENGGAENRVVVEFSGRKETLELAPWEGRLVQIESDGLVTPFSISSQAGFRPSALDPASRDHRDLGVLLRASAPFD
jgi:hypothetical protein